MARADRKGRKKRGSRSCGGGSHKKRRGAGHRGGRGNAGMHKHKWTWVIKYDPHHFGDRGFSVPRDAKHTYDSINVGELDESIDKLLDKKIAKKEGGKIEIDVTEFGCEKVLGAGRVTKPLNVKAQSFSKSAVKKIEDAGGKAILKGE